MSVLGEEDDPLTFTNKSARYIVSLNPLMNRQLLFSISGGGLCHLI
jgi:hypothetical protein